MDYLHELNYELNNDIFFCEIGAFDGKRFDDLYDYIQQYKWKGILVEPLKDAFKKLKENYKNIKGLKYENSAITEQNKIKNIKRVINRKENKLPGWLDGSSSFFDNKHTKKFNFIEEPVKCITFLSLVKKHNIKRIDVLQIDTEGYDLKIFKQIIPYFKPYFIKIEYIHLNKNDRKILKTMLLENGYEVSSKYGNYLAYLPLY